MKVKLYTFVGAILLLVTNLNAQNLDMDSIRIYNLDAVIVKADRVIPKGDHTILYLSETSKNFGTNALDAVSSLEYFKTSINETSLISWDRQDVFILINGVPSSAIDLRAYEGKDIKNIEYYAAAPSQYMSHTLGPVVNVILRKRHDRLYSGYINTSNAVNTGYGTNQADFTYADSLNQVKLGYYLDYRDLKDIEASSEYDYKFRRKSLYEGLSRNSGTYHNVNASYQRYQGKHLFNAKLSYTINPLKDEEIRNGKISSDNMVYLGDGTSVLKNNSNSIIVDLYYRYLMKKGRLFAVNVVNTFGNSYSEAKQIMHTINDNTTYDYDVRSEIDNSSYSFIANAVYASPLWGGSFNLGSRYEYKTLTQTSQNSKYEPYTHNEFLNAAMSWRLNQFSLVPALGLNILSQNASDVSYNSVLPYMRVYADWWGQGTIKGTTIQLTLTHRSISPALSDLAEGCTYIDPWLLSCGNPSLKNYWISSAKLQFAYFAPENKNTIVFQVQPSYSHKPYVSTLSQDEEYIYLMPHNIDGKFDMRMDLFGSWYPFKWLEVSPYVEHYFSNFETPSQKVRWNYWRFGGNIIAKIHKLSMSLYVNSPTKVYDGDLLVRGSWQYAAKLQYKLGKWSLGAMFNYSGHNNYTIADLPNFKYFKRTDVTPLKTLTRITATYRFYIGRSRNHDGKILNETSKDNGLGTYNSVKSY